MRPNENGVRHLNQNVDPYIYVKTILNKIKSTFLSAHPTAINSINSINIDSVFMIKFIHWPTYISSATKRNFSIPSAHFFLNIIILFTS